MQLNANIQQQDSALTTMKGYGCYSYFSSSFVSQHILCGKYVIKPLQLRQYLFSYFVSKPPAVRWASPGPWYDLTFSSSGFTQCSVSWMYWFSSGWHDICSKQSEESEPCSDVSQANAKQEDFNIKAWWFQSHLKQNFSQLTCQFTPLILSWKG